MKWVCRLYFTVWLSSDLHRLVSAGFKNSHFAWKAPQRFLTRPNFGLMQAALNLNFDEVSSLSASSLRRPACLVLICHPVPFHTCKRLCLCRGLSRPGSLPLSRLVRTLQRNKTFARSPFLNPAAHWSFSRSVTLSPAAFLHSSFAPPIPPFNPTSPQCPSLPPTCLNSDRCVIVWLMTIGVTHTPSSDRHTHTHVMLKWNCAYLCAHAFHAHLHITHVHPFCSQWPKWSNSNHCRTLGNDGDIMRNVQNVIYIHIYHLHRADAEYKRCAGTRFKWQWHCRCSNAKHEFKEMPLPQFYINFNHDLKIPCYTHLQICIFHPGL